VPVFHRRNPHVNIGTAHQRAEDLGTITEDLGHRAGAVPSWGRCRTRTDSHAGHFLEKSKLAGGIFVPGPSPTLLYSKPLNWLNFDPNYPKNPKTLGEYIRKWRMEKGLFQKDLANMIGVDETTIVNWEKGKTKPLKDKLRIIKDILKIEPE
jgi:DNA-binding XRE family transcriptional regulator